MTRRGRTVAAWIVLIALAFVTTPIVSAPFHGALGFFVAAAWGVFLGFVSMVAENALEHRAARKALAEALQQYRDDRAAYDAQQ